MPKNPTILTGITHARSGGDFDMAYQILNAEDNALLLKVREFMENDVQPVVSDYWAKNEFPRELIPKMRALGIAGLPYQGYGCPGKSTVLLGFIMMEMARIDSSISTFFGVHSDLAMGSIYHCGSEAQKARWLEPMAEFRKIGSFALGEPDTGQSAGGGVLTTAQRVGDSWILNGQKKWTGNASWADLTIVWARDLDDNQVKGYIVENDRPGFKIEKFDAELSLRVVQNGLITLTDCRIPKDHHLTYANSFSDADKILRGRNATLGWEAVGRATGAYQDALGYMRKQQQSGLATTTLHFIQDRLYQLLCDVTANQSTCLHLSQLLDRETVHHETTPLGPDEGTKWLVAARNSKHHHHPHSV